MSDEKFRALVARQVDGKQSVALEDITLADLPEADTVVAVEASSFNYKDGLALTGKNRILRNYPIVPGIDFAGTVVSSASDRFKAGDAVVLTGWGVGEGWSGGFSERARVKSEWLVKLPDGLTAKQAMAIGTAGLTAMLCVMALQKHGIKDGGDVLVTGAAGGVGSVAVKLLSQLGYKVSALTGRRSEEPFLRALGASAIVDRADYANPGKPLQRELWAGAVDTVGGPLLANVIASTAYDGAVAVCGLAGGADLPSSVFPFILRNVALLGVDSVMCSLAKREEAWGRIASELAAKDLDAVTTTVSLDDLPRLAEEILAGQVRGRTVVTI